MKYCQSKLPFFQSVVFLQQRKVSYGKLTRWKLVSKFKKITKSINVHVIARCKWVQVCTYIRIWTMLLRLYKCKLLLHSTLELAVNRNQWNHKILAQNRLVGGYLKLLSQFTNEASMMLFEMYARFAKNIFIY